MTDGQLWWFLFFGVLLAFAALALLYRAAKRWLPRLASRLCDALGLCATCLWITRGMGWRRAFREAKDCRR